MQLLGVPDRLQENSIYLHPIYQPSSTDGLILRQSPCSSPTSHCNESLLQGIKAPFYSFKSFHRQAKKRGAFHHSRLFWWALKEPHDSLLIPWENKINLSPKMDIQICWCFHLSSFTCFMLSLTMRAPVKVDRCHLRSEGLLGHPEHSSWQK